MCFTIWVNLSVCNDEQLVCRWLMRVRGLCRPRLVSALLVLTSLCLLWAVSSLSDNHTLVPHTDTALSQQQIQDAVVSLLYHSTIKMTSYLHFASRYILNDLVFTVYQSKSWMQFSYFGSHSPTCKSSLTSPLHMEITCKLLILLNSIKVRKKVTVVTKIINSINRLW